MSKLQQELDSHPIHGTVREIHSLLNIAETKWPNMATLEIRRLQKLITKIEVMLSELDADLIVIGWIDELDRELAGPNITGRINEYIHNGEETYLDAVNEQIVGNMPRILTPLQSFSSRGAPLDQIKGTEKMLDSIVQQMDKKAKRVVDSLDAIETRENVIEGRLTTLSEEVETHKQSVDTMITGFRDEHEKAKETRNVEHKKWRIEMNEDADKVINDTKEKLESIEREREEAKDKFLEKTNELQESVVALCGELSGTGEAAYYTQSADGEAKSAKNWQWIFLAIFVTAGLWLVWRTVDLQTIEVNKASGVYYGNLLLRVLNTMSVGGLLVIGLIFSGRQYMAHRTAERQVRKKAHELVAFELFIASLDPEQKIRHRAKFSERYFGGGEEAGDELG